jgi:hypothetical protein
MKTNISSILGGLILMIIGGFALAYQSGYLTILPITSWALIFAATSAFFFIAYFVNGFRAWGWLFPACIFAAVSGTISIVNLHIPGEWIPTLMIGSVAVPFIAAYLIDRTRTWALIPAYVLGLIALILPLENILGSDAIGAFIIAMIGLPFVANYLITPRAWWSIIPGGILLSIGVMIAVSNTINSEISVALMFLGWMATFGLVWKRSRLHAAEWAKYPAVVMGILACIMFLIATGLETFWAIGLIAAGLVLVIMNLRERSAAQIK